MMTECVVSEVSKFDEKDLLVISSNQSEKQIEDESSEENDNSTNTHDENEEEDCEEETVKLDWMSEFPPLLSRGIQVGSVNYVVEKGSWVSALKKPRCPFGVKVNGAKLRINEEEKNVKEVEARFRVANACQEAYAQFRNLQGQQWEMVMMHHPSKLDVRSLSTGEKSVMLPQENIVRSLSTGEKSVMLPQENIHIREKLVVKDERLERKAKEMMRQEADLKHEVNKEVTMEVEETERKEEKLEPVEANETDKREKKRQKRLRLKERKKAAAVATNGSSLDQNPDLKQENATESESWDDKILKEIQELEPNAQKELTSLEQEDVQNMSEKDDTKMRMLQEEERKEEAESAEMRAEFQDKLEAQLREKKREKNLTRKARKKAKAARKKKMKWIWVITFILFTLLCLTIFYIF